jgi:hypothetical protein
MKTRWMRGHPIGCRLPRHRITAAPPSGTRGRSSRTKLDARQVGAARRANPSDSPALCAPSAAAGGTCTRARNSLCRPEAFRSRRISSRLKDRGCGASSAFRRDNPERTIRERLRLDQRGGTAKGYRRAKATKTPTHKPFRKNPELASCGPLRRYNYRTGFAFPRPTCGRGRTRAAV